MFATGRHADTEGLNLKACGVEVQANGKLQVHNEQTNVEHIYAVGDVLNVCINLSRLISLDDFVFLGSARADSSCYPCWSFVGQSIIRWFNGPDGKSFVGCSLVWFGCVVRHSMAVAVTKVENGCLNNFACDGFMCCAFTFDVMHRVVGNR
jgi:hypothetical protein